MDAPVPVIAGRYRLVNRLATGGMGSVWEGWDERLHRPVAVKLLLPPTGTGEDAQVAVDRAMREARITARLHHPNAVPVYDVVEQDGRPCLIMQYVPSRSLAEVLADKGTLAPDVVAGIGAELAAALATAHQAGIVHRDVKPSNVLITEDGTAMLTDFGVSHASGDVTLTSVGMVTGTPAFLAPEVARGAASNAAADVFSLGATLYTALEGAPPFGTAENNPMALLHQVASGRIVPPRRSGPLAPLLTRMLSADPASRPPMVDAGRTLTALRSDLDQLAEPTAVIPAAGLGGIPAGLAAVPVGLAATSTLPPQPPSPTPPPYAAPAVGGPPPRRRRRAAALVVAGLILLLVGVLIAIALANSGSHSPSAPPTSRPSSQPSSPAARSTPPSSPATSASSASSAGSSSHAKDHGKSKGNGDGNGDQSDSMPTASQLAQAITDYYALLPGNTDQAWSRLTARYQNGTAQSRQYYQSFWDAIDSVSTANVTGTAPSTAQATITYHYKDGRTVIEQTSFGLVQQDGQLKIDSSSVQNSQTE